MPAASRRWRALAAAAAAPPPVLPASPPATPATYAVVDTHVHNSDVSHHHYTYPKSFPALAGRNWTIGDYTSAWQAGSGALHVHSVVLMSLEKRPPPPPPPGQPPFDPFGPALAEARFYQSIANRCNVQPTPSDCTPVTGIVADGPMEQGAGAVKAYLPQLTREAPLVKGIRRPLWKDPPSLWLAPQFVDGVRAVGGSDLVFDVLCHKEQLSDVARLVAAAPNTRFNIDHLGYPAVHNASLFDAWAGAVDDIAALPNAHMKLSGMPQIWAELNATLADWPPEVFAPYIRKALEAFGPKRINFASNWFVLDNFGGFTDMAQLTLDVLTQAGATEEDMQYVFSKTAQTLYRL